MSFFFFGFIDSIRAGRQKKNKTESEEIISQSLIHRPIISKVAIIFELQVPIGRIADTTERSWRIRLQTDCTCLAGRSGRIQFPAQEKPVLTTGFYFYFIYQFDSFFLLFICSFFV